MPHASRPSSPVLRRGLAVAAAAALVPLVAAGAAHAAEPAAPVRVAPGPTTRAAGYTVQGLTFTVRIAGGQECAVEAELYRPAGASAAKPVPAVMTTNGFGGSIEDTLQRQISGGLARRGYGVLNYSGLGFGKSGCKITLDRPETDGQAASRLVSYLGGAPVPGGPAVDWVRRDASDHGGARTAHDPRLGLIGLSYGGGFQFALAGIDRRVDTLVPDATWNDLRYSLSPDNGDLGEGATPRTAGSLKTLWATGLFSVGLAKGGLGGLPVDALNRTLVCPGFENELCTDAGSSLAAGGANDGFRARLARSSPATYLDRIRVPVLLAQGEKDSLFNLNEAVATYRGLRRQGTPAKLVWQSFGHSDATPEPGEFDPTFRQSTYVGTTVLDWFDHYLRDDPRAPSLDFTYFRPWRTYSGDATPAYARSAAFPAAPSTVDWRLSADGRLAAPGGATAGGAPSFATTLAGLPTGITTLDLAEFGGTPSNTAGTYRQFTSAPLGAPTDVVGIPTVRIRLQPAAGTAAAAALGPLGRSKAYLRIEDVAPDGSSIAPAGQTSPVTIPADGAPVTVSLAGMAHRFPAGHRLRLTVAGGDLSYRGSVVPTTVAIALDPRDPTLLRMPVVPESAQLPTVRASAPAGAPAATRRRLRVSRLRLTPRRVRARVNAASKVRVRIERRVVRRVRVRGTVRRRAAWRAVRTVRLTARRAGTVRRRTTRLHRGSYRLRAKATAKGFRASRTVTRRVRLR